MTDVSAAASPPSAPSTGILARFPALRRFADEHPIVALLCVGLSIVLLVVIGGQVSSTGGSHAHPLPSDPSAMCQQVWDQSQTDGNTLVTSQGYAQYMNNCLASAQYVHDGNPADLNGTTR